MARKQNPDTDTTDVALDHAGEPTQTTFAQRLAERIRMAPQRAAKEAERKARRELSAAAQEKARRNGTPMDNRPKPPTVEWTEDRDPTAIGQTFHERAAARQASAGSHQLLRVPPRRRPRQTTTTRPGDVPGFGLDGTPLPKGTVYDPGGLEQNQWRELIFGPDAKHPAFFSEADRRQAWTDWGEVLNRQATSYVRPFTAWAAKHYDDVQQSA